MDLADLIQGYANPWLATAATAAVAIALVLVAHAILFAVLRRLARFSVLLSVLVEHARRPAAFVLPLVVVQFVLEAAPGDLRLMHATRNAASLLLIAGITWLGMRIIGAVAETVIRRHPSNVSDNVEARRVQTQTRVLARILMGLVLLIGIGSALMMFPSVRQVGTSLLASAGVAGLVAGIAARPVLGNLIAGLQIALTQPIRLDDVVVVDGEWGRIEDITSAYVVVKLWDERRLVVPLQWFIQNPFQNWTRREAQIIGTVLLWTDYTVPLAALRKELERTVAEAREWDRRVCVLQVVETSEHSVQLRALVSSADSSANWDLRCRVREALVDYLQREHPQALPRTRATIEERSAPKPVEPGAGTAQTRTQRAPTV
jgi:small-conductance mechanosensitive channel